MKSELARMRTKIEEECRSLQISMMYSAMGSHEIIRLKYAHIETRTQELATLVGEDKATDMMCKIYHKVLK